MSQEAVKEFYKVIESDSEIRKQVVNANSSADIVRIAAENGYTFTEEEVEIAMQEALVDGELSDELLEAVAGGGNGKVKCKKGYA